MLKDKFLYEETVKIMSDQNGKNGCKVSPDGSVRLSDILDSFNAPIREEHAWALCYQCAKFFRDCLERRPGTVRTVGDVQDVFLLTDGNVHENTLNSPGQQRSLSSEKEVVMGLGIVIYTALDQATENDKERVISQDLEQLISDMVSDDLTATSTLEQSHHETDDEGIERDAEDAEEASTSTHKTPNQLSLNEVIKRCEGHLGTLTKNQAEAHYKAVVRALVAEALELSTFLEKVAQGSIPSSQTNASLDQLKFSDWAKFWVQVMGELRTGVKLKKVNYSKAPIEYELTPYEILMKDIRSCRYNLRKIMINGDAPSKVTKDAHAIILEFIRSRPPLKKVSERKLAPQSRILTPREQLLNSIKKGRKLKPIPRSSSKMSALKQAIISPREDPITSTVKPARRLIKVDYSQFKDDDEEDEHSYSPEEPGLWSSEYPDLCDSTLEAYDLATQNYSIRRHTLDVIEPPLGCYSVPQSRPCSRQSCNSSEAESIQLEPEVARAMQEELTSSVNWQDAISLDDRLSLTLSEIVHIRAVLTKAELEALPVEGRVRYDVETRRVCFLCLKTRFGIFGPWGQRCTLCKRTVCSKCHSKMNIPIEHFSSVPVGLLSPSILCTPEEEEKHNLRIVGSKTPDSLSRDSSPICSRPGSSMEASIISDPGSISGRFRAKATAVGRASRALDRLKASQMIVCHDCKLMVLQIIKSARANRSAIRNKTLQSLTLNLNCHA